MRHSVPGMCSKPQTLCAGKRTTLVFHSQNQNFGFPAWTDTKIGRSLFVLSEVGKKLIPARRESKLGSILCNRIFPSGTYTFHRGLQTASTDRAKSCKQSRTGQILTSM